MTNVMNNDSNSRQYCVLVKAEEVEIILKIWQERKETREREIYSDTLKPAGIPKIAGWQGT